MTDRARSPAPARPALIVPIFIAGILSAIATGGGGGGEPDLPATLLGTDNYQIAVGDLNGDALGDVIALSSTPDSAGGRSNRLDLFIQDVNQPGSFTPSSPEDLEDVGGTLLLSDLDIDGRPDVAVTQPDAGTLLVLRQFDAVGERFNAQVSYATVGAAGASAAADLDLDGLPDVVLATDTGVAVRIQDGNFPGRFPSQRAIDSTRDPATAAPAGLATLAVADISDDGLVDVIAARTDGVRAYRQDRAVPGSFLPAQALPFLAPPASVAVSDLDLDGRPDIVGVGQEFLAVLLQEPGNPGAFLPQITLSTRPGSATRFIEAQDMNADGLPDVVVGNAAGSGEANTVQVFLQDPQGFALQLAGTYEVPDSVALASALRGLRVGDLNGDGLADVIASQREIYVFLNAAAQPGSLDRAVQISGSEGVPLP